MSSHLSDSPPAVVLAEVRAALERTRELERRGVEVGFAIGDQGLAITLAGPDGERRLRPSELLDLVEA